MVWKKQVGATICPADVAKPSGKREFQLSCSLIYTIWDHGKIEPMLNLGICNFYYSGQVKERAGFPLPNKLRQSL
jgi:hypothetical protein